MKHILITGGSVHAYLDDVKIITNKFKGGLMAKLVEQFVKKGEEIDKFENQIHITYLCSKNSIQPDWNKFINKKNTPFCKIIFHNGIDDYIEKVLHLTPYMDAIILGAAVANLIPKNKIEGKFPSHNYKPGDSIPIEFTIAPRVIDQIKKKNPKILLFGYKLLSDANYYELIDASYGVLLESKAVTIFANDSMDLIQKYAVTKEKGVHPITNNDVMQWVLDRMSEKYYSTIISSDLDINNICTSICKKRLSDIIHSNKKYFTATNEGYIFGSIAVRWDYNSNQFITTERGKNKLTSFVFVKDVDHISKKVYCSTNKKATLNAPLFHYIFSKFSEVMEIHHFHHQRDDLVTLNYSTPGTDKDSIRPEAKKPSFNIEGHGCILSYNKNNILLK